MCQSLPEITGDGACMSARGARVSEFECTRVWTSYAAYENTGTATAYELMNTKRYVRNYQSAVYVNDDRRHLKRTKDDGRWLTRLTRRKCIKL